jgi:hypothetical protein
MRKVSIVRTAALTTTAAQIIGPSEQRVALMFSPTTTAGQHYTVSTDPNVAAGAGLVLSSTTAAILITEERFGDAAKKAWFAVAGASLTIGYLETIVVD